MVRERVKSFHVNCKINVTTVLVQESWRRNFKWRYKLNQVNSWWHTWLAVVCYSPVSRLSWNSCLSSAQPQTSSLFQCLQTPDQSTPGYLPSATPQVNLVKVFQLNLSFVVFSVLMFFSPFQEMLSVNWCVAHVSRTSWWVVALSSLMGHGVKLVTLYHVVPFLPVWVESAR